MRVGLFTDTYFPQVSGVATSIRTLKTELEKLGHTVFIFTTTDKDVNRYEDWQIIRFQVCLSSPLRTAASLIVASQRRLPLPSNTSWILSIPRLSFHWAFWECGLDVSCGFQSFIPTIPSMRTMSAILQEAWLFAQVWSNTL